MRNYDNEIDVILSEFVYLLVARDEDEAIKITKEKIVGLVMDVIDHIAKSVNVDDNESVQINK